MERLHRNLLSVLITFFTLALAGCPEPLEGEVTGTCDDLSKGERDYFEDVMLGEFFDVHCTVCHSSELSPGTGPGSRRGAPMSFNYDSYLGLMVSPRHTWTRVADRTMPPMGRDITDEEAAQLLEFLNCALALAQEEVGGDG